MKVTLLAAGLMALITVSLWPRLHLPFSDNEGLHGCVAQELENGAVLYKDVWDNKPPVLFLLYRAIRASGGKTDLGLHLWVLALHVLIAFLILRLGLKFNLSKGHAWFGAYAYAFFLAAPLFEPWMAEADLLMQPFLLAAVLAALYQTRQAWFVAGLCWSVAFFTKQSAFFLSPSSWR